MQGRGPVRGHINVLNVIANGLIRQLHAEVIRDQEDNSFVIDTTVPASVIMVGRAMELVPLTQEEQTGFQKAFDDIKTAAIKKKEDQRKHYSDFCEELNDLLDRYGAEMSLGKDYDDSESYVTVDFNDGSSFKLL